MNGCLYQHLRQKHCFGLSIRIAKKMDNILLDSLVLKPTCDSRSLEKTRCVYDSLLIGNVLKIHKKPENFYRKYDERLFFLFI